MRAAAVTTVLVGAGLLAGPVLADVVPVPPVTAPTVTVPTVTVPPAPTLPVPTTPTPTTPTAPVTTTQIPAPVPATPVPTTVPATGEGTTVPTVVSPSVTGTAESPLNLASPSGANGSSASGSAGSSSDSGPDRSGLQAVHSSRMWIATGGPKRRGHTILTFTLSRAEAVVFTVRQVSPVCRVAERFTVKGHAGRNRVRVPAGAKPGQLGPGTYSIFARTRSGELIRRVTIVVVGGERVPSRHELAAALTSNVCAAATSFAAADISTGAPNQPVQRALSPGTTRLASGSDNGTSSNSGAVLGSAVEKAAQTIRPLLVALLALSILLLAVASLPLMAVPEARTGDLLARHRTEIAGLGAAAFVAVLITFLLG
jgi:hypothetical protein